MANSIVELPYEYFPDPTKGRPVFNGSVFVGEPDTDPEIEANRKEVTLRQEDGTEVPILPPAQPLTTGAGGVVLFEGSPVVVLVDGAYSLKVLNKGGTQVYYSADVTNGAPLTSDSGQIVFDTVADLVASTVSVGNRVRTLGYTDIGDGGGNDYLIVDSGTGTDDGGSFIDLPTNQAQGLFPDGVVRYEMFGAVGDGIADDTIAVQNTHNFGGNIHTLESTYLYSFLNITTVFSLSGFGVLKYDGSNPTTGTASILISASFSAENLIIGSTGTADLAFDLLRVNADDIYINNLDVSADNQRLAEGGCVFSGSSINIQNISSNNVARPIEFAPLVASTVRTNIEVGKFACINYIRGIKFNYVNDFSVVDVNARVRWTGVTIDTPGFNGVLIESCNDFTFGNCFIANAPEHSVRIGGDADTTNYGFGHIVTVNSSGTSLKINVNTGFHAINGSVVGVSGTNTGEGSVFANKETVRLTKIQGLYIGFINAYETCTRALVIADITNLMVGDIYGENVKARIVETNDGQDGSDANVSGVYISNVFANMDSGARAAFGLQYSAAGRSIANFVIAKSFITGYSNFGAITTGTILSGPLILNMTTTASDPDPAVEDPVSSDFFRINGEKNDLVYRGLAVNQEFSGKQTLDGESFDPSSDPTIHGLYGASGAGATEAQDAYGGSYYFTRVGSTRRAGAVVLKQTGATNLLNGIAFFCQSTGTMSTDAVVERMVLKHTGTLALSDLSTFADDAAAGVGGLVVGDMYMTATGEIRIKL